MTVAFITGCPRSGTSILGQVIGAHPDVEYLFETLRWKAPGSHQLAARHAMPVTVMSLRHELEQERQGKQVTVEKNPRHIVQIPFLRAIWPDCKIIHIVRDGRDVACSLMPGIGNNEWNHLLPPNWQTLWARYRGLERCAHYWQDVMTIGLSDLGIEPHFQVKYEDLLYEPVASVREVLWYLGLGWTNEMDSACKQIANWIDADAPRLTPWCRNDHSKRIGRWRENMTEADKGLVMPILAPMLERLGYV